MRPKNFKEFVGQKEVVSEGSPVRIAVESKKPFSMIFYGPPGSGKTSLAGIIAEKTEAEFFQISAVSSSVKEVRQLIEKAGKLRSEGKTSILFIDEIHRFNKAQQDALLHAVEDGTINLIGATTENPFFEVISPLLSRSHISVLKPLTDKEINKIINNALNKERGLNGKFSIEEGARELIVKNAFGDARRALNILENSAILAEKHNTNDIDLKLVKKVLSAKVRYYDKTGDYHYNFASAFIKSMRASDPDAALAYAVRMLEAGEDPKFLARRMIIFASEDIGNADPMALMVAVSCFLAVEKVGLPECSINLAQGITYLATSPKSNHSYKALKDAQKDAKEIPAITVPKKLRSSVYPGSKKFGHGTGYQYPHNYPGHFVAESLMPEELSGRKYYQPEDSGYEKKIAKRLKKWRELIKKKQKKHNQEQ